MSIYDIPLCLKHMRYSDMFLKLHKLHGAILSGDAGATYFLAKSIMQDAYRMNVIGYPSNLLYYKNTKELEES